MLLFADMLPGRTTLARIVHLGGGRAFTVLCIHGPGARVRTRAFRERGSSGARVVQGLGAALVTQAPAGRVAPQWFQ
jgi:hypothetical protein